MRELIVDNYLIDAPIIDILHKLQTVLTNGKLRDIKEGGDDIVVTCPSHDNGRENRPDCNIYIGNDEKLPFGYTRCFACDFKGSFVHFVATCFDSSEEFAKNWLINNFGSIAFEKKIIIEPIEFKGTSKYYLDKSVLEGYQNYCPYLAKRKVSRETCELFNVKYDPKYRQIIFPVFDENDNLLMLPKRSIDTKVFYLDKNYEKPVYGLNYILKNNVSTCLITEGPIDMLTAYTYGYPAIATLGTISDDQIAKINKSCIKTLYLCMDNDIAGKRFTDILLAKINKRITMIPVKFPDNKKDINDLSYDELTNCLKNAKNAQLL